MSATPEFPKPKSKRPEQCHLWQRETLTSADLHAAFETLRIFVDESHLVRQLKRCKVCGQLYFYEFYEGIDWVGGDDPQYLTYIPIKSEGGIESLGDASQMGLLSFSPRLQSDFPSDAKQPRIYWVGREEERK